MFYSILYYIPRILISQRSENKYAQFILMDWGSTSITVVASWTLCVGFHEFASPTLILDLRAGAGFVEALYYILERIYILM